MKFGVGALETSSNASRRAPEPQPLLLLPDPPLSPPARVCPASQFVELFKSSPDLQWNLIMSGLTFYLYNELATMTIKKTSAVTASVANTAKRVIVMVSNPLPHHHFARNS